MVHVAHLEGVFLFWESFPPNKLVQGSLEDDCRRCVRVCVSSPNSSYPKLRRQTGLSSLHLFILQRQDVYRQSRHKSINLAF